MSQDASQTIGKIPVNVRQLGVDLLTITSHKFYGPKGIGALFVRDGVKLHQLMYGAGHERHMRPGTENVLLVRLTVILFLSPLYPSAFPAFVVIASRSRLVDSVLPVKM